MLDWYVRNKVDILEEERLSLTSEWSRLWPMKDYDGFVSDWLAARIIPPNLKGMVEHVKKNIPAGSEILELGCGNGLLAAILTHEGYKVTAVDERYPITTEPSFPFMLTSVASDEFFELAKNFKYFIGRRTFCLFYSDEWTERLNALPVSMLVIESLNGEKHYFRNSVVESAYLTAHGWDVSYEGKYLVAQRAQPKQQSRKRHQASDEQPSQS